MSFPRHRRSIHPMWKQTGSRLDAHSRLSSARMSRGRLFLGGSVSTGARFRFIGCGQNAVQWSCPSSNLQRTANSVLFACLSRGVHPTFGIGPQERPENTIARRRRKTCSLLHTFGQPPFVLWQDSAMAETCFRKKDSNPPVCGVHSVLLVRKQSSDDLTASKFGDFASDPLANGRTSSLPGMAPRISLGRAARSCATEEKRSPGAMPWLLVSWGLGNLCAGV
jgi:hypothetical protein